MNYNILNTKNTLNYKQAPLPFQGQKRRFLKEFSKVLTEFSDDFLFVDLFGGSGLLSHTIKQLYPNARVVWNDFDDYSERLKNISKTNEIVCKLREILGEFSEEKRIEEPLRSEIFSLLENAHNQGFMDWITLSANLLFSGKYALSLEDFKKQTLYHCVKKSPYQAEGYLQGVERVCEDYKALYERFKDTEKVVFVIDPPYLSTDSKTYGSDKYWTLRDYLDVLDTLSGNYVYFTSDKSQIVELCAWIETRTPMSNPFKNATCTSVAGSVAYNASYTDMMYHYKVK